MTESNVFRPQGTPFELPLSSMAAQSCIQSKCLGSLFWGFARDHVGQRFIAPPAPADRRRRSPLHLSYTEQRTGMCFSGTRRRGKYMGIILLLWTQCSKTGQVHSVLHALLCITARSLVTALRGPSFGGGRSAAALVRLVLARILEKPCGTR